MTKPLISIIAAIGSNRELGKNNKLLWHIPEDFRRFKDITSHHPVIMGRTTFQSIGKPLPGRFNIVVTRDTGFRAGGCIITHSLEEALKIAKEKDKDEIFIIGGGQIYEQGIKFTDKLYLTIVDGNFDADTFFPDYSDFGKIVYTKNCRWDKSKYTFLEIIRE